jgi:RNA-directed DNA polymerase
MSQLTALKSAKTRDDVAALLQTSKKGLATILFSRKIVTRYTTFEIPKKHGGTRTIKAPDDKLKLLQQKLSTLLQDCLQEIEAVTGKQDKVAHGFKRKRSIIDNAQRHRNRRWVFNIDLKDFFPSINFGRVRGFFMKDKNFLLEKDVATVLAQIACDGQALPQGSPCSPVISNLIAHILDMHIVRIASRAGCTYTRYADDLTFSTNQREFPQDLAVKTNTTPAVWLPGSKLVKLIEHSDFRVNERKTRMCFRDFRQDVTGLIVNKKINVPSEYRQTVRAMVYRLFKTGSFDLVGFVKTNGIVQLGSRKGTLNELHGRLGFIDSIDLHNQDLAAKQGTRLPLTTKESMFRQFLIYRDFYTADRPVILCEGKTDIVYIKHAIRSLAANFPDLAEVDAKGDILLKVRLYRYTKTSTGRILGLKDGGSSHLASFIGSYRRDTDKFLAPGLLKPVIILYDSDSGANKVCSSAKQASLNNKAVNAEDPFTHVIKNLYILPTPVPAGSQNSEIEDFFDLATKQTLFKGKTFSPANDHDKSKFYGKAEFANQVVAANAKTINFSGFSPLLQNMALIIQQHAKLVSVHQPQTYSPLSAR